ncbi:hypothetical protein Tco_1099708 [Tanacetum coccineum]
MSKLLYTHFTKLIINHFLSCNKSIPRRSNSELHSAQDDQPVTKFSNTVKGDYKFRMEILNTMISDAIKKSAGYKYYIAKKKESAKDKIVDEPEEQRVYPVKSGRGKGFKCYGDQVVNVPNKFKKDVEPRKRRTLTIVEEIVVDTYAEWEQKLKEEIDNEIDDADDSNMDLSDDNPDGDDDAARFGVFMYNKSIETPNYTYLSPTVTSSSLDFIQNLLNETPANELTGLVSHPVYTDAQTTSARSGVGGYGGDNDEMVMGMKVAFIGDGGGVWRYGDDGGDDLDGIVEVWWLRQQGAAKVAAASTGGRNLAGWRRRRRKIRRGGRCV